MNLVRSVQSTSVVALAGDGDGDGAGVGGVLAVGQLVIHALDQGVAVGVGHDGLLSLLAAAVGDVLGVLHGEGALQGGLVGVGGVDLLVVVDGVGVLAVDGVAARVGAVGGRAVGHGTGGDVGVGHHVGGVELTALAGGQGDVGLAKAGLGVGHGDAAHGHVALVGHLDGVLHGVARGVRAGGGSLLDNQVVGDGLGRGVGAALVAGHGVAAGVGRGAGGHVDDLAGHHVGLGHHVAGADDLGLAASQVKGIGDKPGELVGHHDAGEVDVAVVNHGQRVVDHVAGLDVSRAAVGLNDCEGRRGLLGVVLVGARGDGGRVHGVNRVVAGGGRAVDDLAGHDVGLLHGIGEVQVLGLAGQQAGDLGGLALGQDDAFQLIGDVDVVDRQVAGVLDGDGVVDDVALLEQGVGRNVAGLGDGELRVGRVDVGLVVGRELLVRAREARGRGVGELAGQDVLLLDDVGGGGAHGLAGLDVLEDALLEQGALDLVDGHGLGRVVDVGGRDGEGHGVAQAVGAGLVRLGDHNVVVDVVGHLEGADLLDDGVVGPLGGVAVAADEAQEAGVGPLDGVGVGRAAHHGLAAGGGKADGLALGQAAVRAGGEEGLAVVGLGRVGGGDGQRRGHDLVGGGAGAGVVALAGDGHGHGAGVGGVLAVGQLVVHALDQGVAGGGVLDDGVLLLGGAVVGDVVGVAHGEGALKRGLVRVVGVGLDGVVDGLFAGGLDVVARRVGALGGGDVLQRAGRDVLVGHDVAGGVGLGLALGQRHRLVEAGLGVGHLDVVDRHVAGVGHRDGVIHGVARGVGAGGGGLDDAQRAVDGLGLGGRLTAAGDNVAGRVIGRGGGHVPDGAGDHVVLGHGIGLREGLGLAARQVEALAREADQLVGHHDAGEVDVAVVGGGDRVGDHVARGHAGGLVGLLANEQRGRRLLGRVGLLARGHLGVLVGRVVGGRRRGVGHIAGHDVGLLHGVAVMQGDAGAGGQAGDGRALALGESRAGQLVGHDDVGQRQVAGVLDGDGVVDDVALLEQGALGHVARLGDDELRVGLIDLLIGGVSADGLGVLAGRCDVLAGLGVLDGVGLGGRDVLVGAGDDVGLVDHVRGREGLGLAHRQRGDGLVQAGLGVGHYNVVVRHVALVGNSDGVLDRLAQLVRAGHGRLGGLGDLKGGVQSVDLGVNLTGGGVGLGLVVIGGATGGGRHVDDLAGENIVGGHDVLGGIGLGGANRQLGNSYRLKAIGIGVHDLDVEDSHVAVVGNRDAVLNGVA